MWAWSTKEVDQKIWDVELTATEKPPGEPNPALRNFGNRVKISCLKNVI